MKHLANNAEWFHKQYKAYERKIPWYGAILLSKDLKWILIVHTFKRDRLTFPKGKQEEGESGPECAIREVKEEIGYDLSGLIDP